MQFNQKFNLFLCEFEKNEMNWNTHLLPDHTATCLWFYSNKHTSTSFDRLKSLQKKACTWTKSKHVNMFFVRSSNASLCLCLFFFYFVGFLCVKSDFPINLSHVKWTRSLYRVCVLFRTSRKWANKNMALKIFPE